MIDKKKIEEAAKEYNLKVENELSKRLIQKQTSGEKFAFTVCRENSFVAGAHWAIEQFFKELWHDAKEEPRNDYGLVVTHSSIGFLYPMDMNEVMNRSVDNNYSVIWQKIVMANKIDKWFYIDDLTKKGGSDEGV